MSRFYFQGRSNLFPGCRKAMASILLARTKSPFLKTCSGDLILCKYSLASLDLQTRTSGSIPTIIKSHSITQRAASQHAQVLLSFRQNTTRILKNLGSSLSLSPAPTPFLEIPTSLSDQTLLIQRQMENAPSIEVFKQRLNLLGTFSHGGEAETRWPWRALPSLRFYSAYMSPWIVTSHSPSLT